MAKKTVMLDDLDDSKEAEETLLYMLDGEYWEIDLSAENSKKLRDALAKYIKVSRSVSPKEAARRVSMNGSGVAGTSYGEYDPAVVRAWAQANGVDVSEKGRIPEHVVGQWRRATRDTSST
jgi:hypothetical protein